jgi:hypothetical protein
MKKSKLIVRLLGGIGNQLFIYATSKALALKNNAELIIDIKSGFENDYKHKRQCELYHFNLKMNIAKKNDRLEPFAKYRRFLMRKFNQLFSFEKRNYIVQEGNDFDRRLLDYKILRNTYIEGHWQSELYFKDIESTIREEFKFIPPTDSLNTNVYKQITEKNKNSIAIHYRFFVDPNSISDSNISKIYYEKALVEIEKRIEDPHYFIFSDRPTEAIKILALPTSKYTLVSHNTDDSMAYADLWLMSNCKHFIIANSTFSWWGAWLSNSINKIIIAPNYFIENPVGSWNFKGQLPDTWLKL